MPAKDALLERLEAGISEQQLEAAVRPQECSEDEIDRRMKGLIERTAYAGRRRYLRREYVRRYSRDSQEEGAS